MRTLHDSTISVETVEDTEALKSAYEFLTYIDKVGAIMLTILCRILI